MHVTRLLLLSSAVATLVSLPAMADTFVTYPQPVSAYTSSTTNYGGGDASGTTISTLGPFSFSSAMTQAQVPPSWATWNSPPATESSTPNVLWGVDATTLTLTLSGSHNTAGFELEPDAFAAEMVNVSFFNGGTLIDTISLTPNGSGGALLFALTDTTPGASISSIVITDTAGDDFALAQLRAGSAAAATPEPSSLALLGTGLLSAVGMLRRRRMV